MRRDKGEECDDDGKLKVQKSHRKKEMPTLKKKQNLIKGKAC